MSNTIKYVVSYDSDYLNLDGSVNASAIVLAPIKSLTFRRNIAPSEDNAELTLAGIGYIDSMGVQHAVQSAREIYIYRVNSDGTYTLKFRGMTTNPQYHVADDELSTTVQINSLWYMLMTRLFQIAGKSPPPLQPNTNPYLVYLNPTLGLDFGILWADILVSAFQGSYSTGHLPSFHLANITDAGQGNVNIGVNPPYVTDFDNIIVNEQMNVQYMSISAVIDKLVQAALFNSDQGLPFLAEYRMDIGDYLSLGDIIGKTTTGTIATTMNDTSLSLSTNALVGYTLTYLTGPAVGQSRAITANTATTISTAAFLPAPNDSSDAFEVLLPKTERPKFPTVTVMLFDPVHGKLGNGNNRSGITIGDFATQIDPAGTLPGALTFPMAYVEFGVTNGYEPIDTIIFSEGDNIVSIDLTYDYLSMNNSYVLTGGSFQGSDVVALPIDNQRSIAEYGLKQTTQSLQNVVDPGEIQRYVGTSINFFQHPIPNIVIKPDYVYASTHTMYAGDYILVNAPSLAGVLEDSNGNPLIAYNAATAAFTARIKTIDIAWNPEDGEDITLTLTFPVQNVPIAEWNPAYNNFQQQGSLGGAIQSMYTVVEPAAKTLLGKGRQQEGAALYASGGDFLTNKTSPSTVSVADVKPAAVVVPDSESLEIQMFAQTISNNMTAILTDGSSVKGDDILIHQFGVEVDTPNSTSSIASAPSDVYLTVLQPDGMAIYDGIVPINQMTNILSLISKSHINPPALLASAPLLEDGVKNPNLSGIYQIIVRNSKAFAWCPNPLFASLPMPTVVTTNWTTGYTELYGWIYCPVDASNHEFGMSFPFTLFTGTALLTGIQLTWPAVAGAVGYNLYYYYQLGGIGATANIMLYNYLDYTATNSYGPYDQNHVPVPTPASVLTQPFDAPVGLNVQYSGIAVPTGSRMHANDVFWYVVSAINPEGVETECSQASTIYNGDNRTAGGQPDNNRVPEPNGATTVNGDSNVGTYKVYVASVVGFNAGFGVEIGHGTGRDEFNTIMGVYVAPNYLLLSTPLLYTHLAADADPVTDVTAIEIEWPVVPHAQSYNIYVEKNAAFDPTGASFQFLTNTTATTFLDDGSITPTSQTPQLSTQIAVNNVFYSIFSNYALSQDSAHTKTASAGGSNNPANAIIYDPTQRRIYQTHPYVAP